MAALTNDSPFQIQTQYVKDLSFENPHAPEVFVTLSKVQPEVNVDIDLASKHLVERTFEVVLNLRVGAKVDGKTAFLVDLHYAVLINVHPDLPEAEIEPLLLKEGPHFIFPFARAVLADVTREGGFPPLVINPIDFNRFYQRHHQKPNGQDTSAQDAPVTDNETSKKD